MNANRTYWAATIACSLTSSAALCMLALIPYSLTLLILTAIMWLTGTVSTAFIIAKSAPHCNTPGL